MLVFRPITSQHAKYTTTYNYWEYRITIAPAIAIISTNQQAKCNILQLLGAYNYVC